jgi:hypothetical protein
VWSSHLYVLNHWEAKFEDETEIETSQQLAQIEAQQAVFHMHIMETK